MKAKVKKYSRINEKVDRIFKNRDKNIKAFSSAGRVPKHSHYAVVVKKENR